MSLSNPYLLEQLHAGRKADAEAQAAAGGIRAHQHHPRGPRLWRRGGRYAP